MVVVLMVVLVLLAWGIISAVNKNTETAYAIHQDQRADAARALNPPAYPGAFKNFNWAMSLQDVQRLNPTGNIVDGHWVVKEDGMKLQFELFEDGYLRRLFVYRPKEGDTYALALRNMVTEGGPPRREGKNPRWASWNDGELETDLIDQEARGIKVTIAPTAQLRERIDLKLGRGTKKPEPAAKKSADDEAFAKIMALQWGAQSPEVTDLLPGGETVVNEAHGLGSYHLMFPGTHYMLAFDLEDLGLNGVSIAKEMDAERVKGGLKEIVDEMSVLFGKPDFVNEKHAGWSLKNFCREGVKENTGLSVSLKGDKMSWAFIRITPESVRAHQRDEGA